MERGSIIDVWTEVQIDEDGIGFTVVSECDEVGAVVEDVEYHEFEELEAGEMFSLNLSQNTRSQLSGQSLKIDDFDESRSLIDEVEPGTVVRDTNPPSWSENNRLVVVSIPDKTADQYVVEQRAGTLPNETVADANSSCDPDEPVIECVYPEDTCFDEAEEAYAFPESRLELVGE